MKTFLTLFLAFFTAITFAKADRILIYNGYQVSRANRGPGNLTHVYWLFDLDTSRLNYVLYGGTGSGKAFTTGTAASFVDQPVTTFLGTTRTYFQYGSSDMSATFALNFGSFSGENEVYANLGDSLSGAFPPALTFNSYNLTGSGTPNTASVDTAVGYSNLDLSLTRQSNASNDSLGTATTAVTDFLGQQGYTSQ